MKRIFRDVRYKVMKTLIKNITPELYKEIKRISSMGSAFNMKYFNFEIGIPRQSTVFMKKYFQNHKVIGAEIGVLNGYNSENLLKELNIKKLYLIDYFESYTGIDLYKRNINNYEKIKKKFKNNPKVEIIKALSIEASELFKNESLDFVYIDANHKYNYVLMDLIKWYPKIKYSGILSGHDYGNYKTNGVKKAVKDWTNYKNIKYTEAFPDFYLIKR